jgi:antitoxin Phd
MTAWKMEDAKNRFSEVVRRAASEGPQFVTKHGREAAVVMGVEEYRRLTQPVDLVDFLSESPLAVALEAGELVLDRPRDLGRDPVL